MQPPPVAVELRPDHRSPDPDIGLLSQIFNRNHLNFKSTFLEVSVIKYFVVKNIQLEFGGVGDIYVYI